MESFDNHLHSSYFEQLSERGRSYFDQITSNDDFSHEFAFYMAIYFDFYHHIHPVQLTTMDAEDFRNIYSNPKSEFCPNYFRFLYKEDKNLRTSFLKQLIIYY